MHLALPASGVTREFDALIARATTSADGRQRQRRRVDSRANLPMAGGRRRRVALHRSGQADTERLRREPQRTAARRMPPRTPVPHLACWDGRGKGTNRGHHGDTQPAIARRQELSGRFRPEPDSDSVRSMGVATRWLFSPCSQGRPSNGNSIFVRSNNALSLSRTSLAGGDTRLHWAGVRSCGFLPLSAASAIRPSSSARSSSSSRSLAARISSCWRWNGTSP